jgi:calcineurin-like phosphoesterase family protein
MSGFWITSDLHFYHEAILRFCSDTRPWRSIEEMNQALIDEWNSKIQPNHTIYHLGDFCFGKFDSIAKRADEILDQLNGNKIFLKGNHDTSEVCNVLAKHGELHNYLEIKHNKQFIVMSHFPFACWNKANYNSLHAFGHCHGSFEGFGKSLDVGYDAHGKILSLDDFVELALAKKKEILDGH